jgi:predicted secreted protein
MRTLTLTAFALALSTANLAARPVRYTPLPEQVPADLAQADGEVVVRNCSGCHSLEYIVTQPRSKGAQFWRDSVTKMITVYKAPIEPAEAEAVSAALAAKFG